MCFSYTSHEIFKTNFKGKSISITKRKANSNCSARVFELFCNGSTHLILRVLFKLFNCLSLATGPRALTKGSKYSIKLTIAKAGNYCKSPGTNFLKRRENA